MADEDTISGGPVPERQNAGYEVGYGKPPAATRFKPGQSGNKKGRPKGSGNFSTSLENELRVPVFITENGKRKRVMKQDIIAKQLVNKGAGGDPRFMPVLLNEIHKHETQQAAMIIQKEPSPKDKLVMDSIITRIRSTSGQVASVTESATQTPPVIHKEPEDDNSDT